MHEITLPNGSKHMVPTVVRTEMAASQVKPTWQELPGHVDGRYSNHRDPVVQAAALAWRLSGASVTVGYTACRLQSGADLVSAANAAAKRAGFPSAAAAKRHNA